MSVRVAISPQIANTEFYRFGSLLIIQYVLAGF